MDERKVYKDALSKLAPDMTDEQKEKYLDFMEKKKSTILKGDDVIHLDYFHGLIDDLDIQHVTEQLQEINIRLSRYDKNGITYASLQDFTLQVSLSLKDPIVQGVIAGLAVNSIWAGIKRAVVYLWHKFKDRRQSIIGSAKMNFGLRIQVQKDTWIDFKLDGEFSEQTVLTALDKVIPMIQEKSKFEAEKLNFLVFNPDTSEWHLVDTMAEFRRIAAEQQIKRNSQ